MRRTAIPTPYHEAIPLQTGGRIEVTWGRYEKPPSITLTVLKWIYRHIKELV